MTELTDNLLLAVAQPPTARCKPLVNARAHANAIHSARARVIVFPELSLTGYDFDAPPMTLNDPAFQIVANACATTDTVALVGAPTYVPGSDQQAHISMVAISGNGISVAYNKVHLGAGEQSRFTPGTSVEVAEIDGWRLGLSICRDCGQTGHAEQAVAAGIDIYVAAVVESAANQGMLNDRAASITKAHKVWVAIASFAGPTGEGYDTTAGRSGIWRPDGTKAVSAGTRPGSVAMALLTR